MSFEKVWEDKQPNKIRQVLSYTPDRSHFHGEIEYFGVCTEHCPGLRPPDLGIGIVEEVKTDEKLS
jgi:hypothetical protein